MPAKPNAAEHHATAAAHHETQGGEASKAHAEQHGVGWKKAG